uniref:Uncharacterized protein n=1 Tax=Ditylenchus dipsaci TaxID=166011 RepID=A0A915E7F9_9BILA
MASNVLFIFSLAIVVLIFYFHDAKATAAGEQKTINKVKAYVTNFLTDDQLHTICANLSVGIYQMKNTSQLADDVQTIILNSLTNSQTATIMPIMQSLNRDFGSLSAAKEAMKPMFTALSNNLTPVLEQMQAKDVDWTNEGKGQTACIAQQYRMIDSFFTVTRTKTIITRMKEATPPKNWTYIYNDLHDVVFFAKYVTA